MSVFFTSDLHFGHRNLVEGLRNSTIEENAKLIIDNWNKTVDKHDLVYILGDITMESPKLIQQYISKLRGNIYVIGGNHDTRQCCQILNDMHIPVMGCMDYKGFMVTHVPMSSDEVQHHIGNIHGHVHRFNTTEYFIGKYYNVNCEFHNYTPVSFDEIVDKFRNPQIIY